jgi:hypothetical protein
MTTTPISSRFVQDNNSNVKKNQKLINNSIFQSVLLVNVKELNLSLYNDIIVSWNILEDTSTLDWIGIYKIGWHLYLFQY